MKGIDKKYLHGLYDLLKRRLTDPDVEWQDITDYMNQYSNTTYSREYLRKAAPLFYLFDEASWVRPPEGSDTLDTDVGVQSKTTALNADGSESSEAKFVIDNEEKLRDPSYLLEIHGYDPQKFDLISAKNTRWTTSSNGTTLYSSKISVKPKPFEVSLKDIEEWFKKLDRVYSRAEPKKIDGWGEGDKLLVIPISDLHFNLQATVFSSGNEYNCEIAEKIFLHIIHDVLSETERYKFSKIIFTIGGDQFNADNLNNTTLKGTPQDCHKLYFDACEHMYAMTVRAVDMLAEKAPVDVIYVPANHDKVTGFHLAKFVSAWFRCDDRVSVDYSPLPRKYTVFGKTLFCFAHDANVKEIRSLIPVEARHLWSQVDFAEVMLQHYHTESILSEKYSTRISRLPSPSAKSTWANDSGYGSLRQCKSFIYDSEYGLRKVIYTVIPELE